MDRGSGLNEDIGVSVRGASQQEGNFLLTCETCGLGNMCIEDNMDCVLPVHKAIARIADRGVVTSGVYRGLAMEAT